MTGLLRVIGGELRRRSIRVPAGARPTSNRAREALFDILSGRIEGASVLDLYAGSGAVAIEAISRGAAHATAVDLDVRVLSQNARHLGIELEILKVPVERSINELTRAGRRFDIVFVDPPYDVTFLPHLPGASGLLLPDGLLVVQTEKITDLPPQAGWLARTRVAKFGRNVFHFFNAS